MKKSIVFVLMTCLLIVGTMSKSYAAPVYYTWEGNIRSAASIGSSYDDGAGIIANAGLSEGSPVSFTVMIDKELDGYYRNSDGDLITRVDVYDPTTDFTTDYFYAELISSPLMDYYSGNPPPWSESDHHWARTADEGTQPYQTPNTRAIVGDDSGCYVNIVGSYGQDIDLWYEGMDFYYIHETVWNDSGERSSYDSVSSSGLRLVSISPVPIPSAIWLLGSGLIGLLGFRRRFRV